MRLPRITGSAFLFISTSLGAALPSTTSPTQASPTQTKLTEPVVATESPVEHLAFDKITPAASLQWQPCLSGFFCAVLDVPLDYSKPNGFRAMLPLIKWPAQASDYKGIAMTNPGGPGESSIDFLVNSAKGLQKVIGLNYDLIAWEPRGLGYSLPFANCTIPAFDSNGTMSARRVRRTSYEHSPDEFLAQQYEYATRVGGACGEVLGAESAAGSHMTTATVVRDMISILDAFSQTPEASKAQNPTLLNYWGFSYGTMIGQTFASMFPDRVGRVVLDGNVEPNDYVSGQERTTLQHTDEAFSMFFVYCSLAGTACEYKTGSTPHHVFLRFKHNILSRLDVMEAVKQKWENATLIERTLDAIKFNALTSSYTPISSFPKLAQLFVGVEKAVVNLTKESLKELEDELAKEEGDDESADDAAGPTLTAVVRTVISCSDNGNVLYNAGLDKVRPMIELLQQQSYIGGEALGTNVLACVGWGVKGTEIFKGPFGGRTKNPLLFVSNTRDPVTPIDNGKKGAESYEGAQLLTIDGTGHSSLNLRNKCAFQKIQEYFQEGKLPGKDNICVQESGPWNITLIGDSRLKRKMEVLQGHMDELKK